MATKKTATRKRAARAKSKKKAPARKPRAKPKRVRLKSPSARPLARELPNDEAWRALVETAVEKPDPVGRAAAPKK